MSTIALFSDIHANIDAFRAVINDATSQGANLWFGLGDIVGYGPEPGECVKIARERFAKCVIGNHEAMLRGISSNKECDEYGGSVGWPLKIVRRQLGKSAAMKWLLQLPLVIEENDLMLVHASPYRPDSFTYIHNLEDAKASFECQSASLVFYGHTHVPATWEMHGSQIQQTTPGDRPIELKPCSRYLVNVGSVGQPRDDDPRACYVIYDPENRTVRFRRIAYDIKSAQERFIKAGLLSRSALRLEKGE